MWAACQKCEEDACKMERSRSSFCEYFGMKIENCGDQEKQQDLEGLQFWKQTKNLKTKWKLKKKRQNNGNCTHFRKRSNAHYMCIWTTKQKTKHRKVRFYGEVVNEWDLGSSSEIILSSSDFSGHVGKCAEGFEGTFFLNAEGRRLLEFHDEKELRMANT